MKTFTKAVGFGLSLLLVGGCAAPKKNTSNGTEPAGDPDILRAASKAAALITRGQCGPAQKAMMDLFDAQEAGALPMAFGALWGVLSKKPDVGPVLAYLDDMKTTNLIASGYLHKCADAMPMAQPTGYWPGIAEADKEVAAALARNQCLTAKNRWGQASEVFRNGFLEEPRAVFLSVRTAQDAANARENLKIFNEHLSLYGRMVYQCGR